MSFVFAPKGWALSNGQLLPINQNQALFSLLGTTFGGDGRVNFALPDLRGRTPIHVGSGHTLGERGGEPAHTLSISEIPTHTHVMNGSTAAGTSGVAVANVTGDPFPDVARREVLDPLAMYDTGFSTTPAMNARAATGYHARRSPTRWLLPRWVVGRPAGRWVALAATLALPLADKTR